MENLREEQEGKGVRIENKSEQIGLAEGVRANENRGLETVSRAIGIDSVLRCTLAQKHTRTTVRQSVDV